MMIKNKQTARVVGMAIGIVVFGLLYGITMDNIAIGIPIGVALGPTFGKMLAGEELVEDKKTQRRVSWSMMGLLILGSAVFGLYEGNLIEGIAAGIGFSFVVGLKWEKLYDERMSSMFSKAARNAFVVVNAGFSFVVFFGEIVKYTPLNAIPTIELLKYVIYISWAVFLASWLYHANYKGE